MGKVITTAVVSMTLAAALGGASAALAECTSQVNRFPAFEAVAPSAATVVIGTVVENLRGHDGAVATFRLAVDEVLRGAPEDTIDILGLKSGLPLRGDEACRENAFVYAQVGDVLAVAFDGTRGDRTGVNTAAFIQGRPEAGKPRVDVLSRADVYAALGLDAQAALQITSIGEQVSEIGARLDAWFQSL
jgi:hypothetical protein